MCAHMSVDYYPIPHEALPPGWGPAECRDDNMAYRHSTFSLTLVADRTTPDRSHPGLGLCHCWELRYQYALGNQSVDEPIGRVSTRSAAIDGLLECMHRIHDAADPSDPIETQAVLDRVSLADVVPDGL